MFDMVLYDNSNRQITKNFTEKELFTKAPGVSEHFLSDKTITGLQIVRNYYNIPVIVTSTYRPIWYNRLQGSKDTSQHVLMKAIDFTFKDKSYIEKYNQEIKIRGQLYRKLYKAGIRGYGLYDNFAHIDSRTTLAFWDNSKKKIYSYNADDGLNVSLETKIIMFLLIVLFTISIFSLWRN